MAGSVRAKQAAKTRGRPRREPDALDRANQVALGVIRIAGLVKTIEGMEDGPSKRKMMAMVEVMIADLQRIHP